VQVIKRYLDRVSWLVEASLEAMSQGVTVASLIECAML